MPANVMRLSAAGALGLIWLLCAGIEPTAAQSVVAVVTDVSGAQLRAGPGPDYPSVAIIPAGTELAILGAALNGGWIPVAYQGRDGFVSGRSVEVRTAGSSTPRATPAPAPTPTPMSTPQPTPAPQQMRVTSPDGLNLRAGPGTDQRVLTVIPFSTRITVTQRSADGRWGQVTYGGQTGWVDTQFLAPATDAAASGPTPPASTADPYGTGRYIWPVAGRAITTYFSPSHPGIDIDQYPSGGNPVVASAAGTVIFAGGNACCSYGLYVQLRHRDGAETLYAHLSSTDVRVGQELAQGQMLGRSGNTGLSTGAHLHFELHIDGTPRDPLAYLPPIRT